jgi:hypothetical protein
MLASVMLAKQSLILAKQSLAAHAASSMLRHARRASMLSDEMFSNAC